MTNKGNDELHRQVLRLEPKQPCLSPHHLHLASSGLLFKHSAPAADDDEDRGVGQDHQDEQGVEGVTDVDPEHVEDFLDLSPGESEQVVVAAHFGSLK